MGIDVRKRDDALPGRVNDSVCDEATDGSWFGADGMESRMYLALCRNIVDKMGISAMLPCRRNAMRIIARFEFSLLDYSQTKNTRERHPVLTAGTYGLIPANNTEAGLSGVLMYVLLAQRTIGACQGWWQNEVDCGRMAWG